MKSRIQRRSRLQEKRIARDVGGRVQAGSGNSWKAKGDVRKQGQLRIEAKFTEKGVYRLKLAELQKIKEEAIRGGLETPVMQVEFLVPHASFKLAVLDFTLFCHLRAFRGDEKALHQYAISTHGKQIPLHSMDLASFRGRALDLGGDWCFVATFTESPGAVFAITDWAQFVELFEEFNGV